MTNDEHSLHVGRIGVVVTYDNTADTCGRGGPTDIAAQHRPAIATQIGLELLKLSYQLRCKRIVNEQHDLTTVVRYGQFDTRGDITRPGNTTSNAHDAVVIGGPDGNSVVLVLRGRCRRGRDRTTPCGGRPELAIERDAGGARSGWPGQGNARWRTLRSG